ncbi:MAG TPA: hypothetical protein PLR25_28345, partial [Planctomycetaceae bacterium]|nr:hypothetical protein [Planctomycetaceae bacterium]
LMRKLHFPDLLCFGSLQFFVFFGFLEQNLIAPPKSPLKVLYQIAICRKPHALKHFTDEYVLTQQRDRKP